VAVFLRFLRRLFHLSRTPVFIVDRHPVHGAMAVHQWLAAHAALIRLFFLPACSPGYLNQDIKSKELGRPRPRTQPEMLGTRARRTFRATSRPSLCSNAAQHWVSCIERSR